MLENGDGSMSCDMRYRSYTIRDGKYSLPGLPAVYADNDEAQTLEIVLEDPVTGVEACFFMVCFRSWISLQEASISAIRAVRRFM